MSRSTVSQFEEHLSGEALYPFLPARPRGHGARSGAVAQAGGVLLTRAAEATGLTAALRAELGVWRKPLAVHDPGKMLSESALSLALGGDCLADLGLLRADPGVYGAVACEATVSRTLSTLAGYADAAIRAISRARAAARKQAWGLAGAAGPGHGAASAAPLVGDIEATIVIAHSEKEQTAGTHKRAYGFHPLLACRSSPGGAWPGSRRGPGEGGPCAGP